MFEPVEDLSRRLPHPKWTGDATSDWRVVERHIANGRLLRSEAFACLGRALIAKFRRGSERRTASFEGTPSHQM